MEAAGNEPAAVFGASGRWSSGRHSFCDCAAPVRYLSVIYRSAIHHSGIHYLAVHHSAVLRPAVWSIPQASTAQPRQVALTFDDGPHQTCTPALLDGLKKRGVKATFFLMGENIAGKESLVQRMQEEGHLIGNHSYRHIQMTKEGAEQACAEIEQTETLIQDITGRRPEYLRPPYGAWNEQLECRVNLTTVLWNVDSLDWKLQNTEQIVRRVEKDVKNGDIILMHDIFPTSVEAALRIVDDLQKQGYEFVTVEELLVD